MKKPSSVTKAAKAADALHAQPEDVISYQESLVGGGKDQSYIQHQPDGPGTSKRLIVSIPSKMASACTKDHKCLIKELLPNCKAKGSTKKSVLLARKKLLDKYSK